MRFLLFLMFAFIAEAKCEPPAYKEVTIVKSSKIDENSGIDLSARYPGAVWTHNDSGGKPYLFLVSLKTGDTLGTIELAHSINRDWEDITTYSQGGKSYIVVGDTGDNLRRRKGYQLCIFEEPGIDFTSTDPGIQKIERWIDLQFTYEDGPKNCESIGVDLERNKIILIEKIYPELAGISGVYELDIPAKSTDKAVARRIAELSSKNFSAMDISDDGRALIVRAYHAGYLYRRTGGESWAEVLSGPMPRPFIFPMQKQGEGVCFTTDGKAVLISTEKKRQPIYEVELPSASASR